MINSSFKQNLVDMLIRQFVLVLGDQSAIFDGRSALEMESKAKALKEIAETISALKKAGLCEIESEQLDLAWARLSLMVQE